MKSSKVLLMAILTAGLLQACDSDDDVVQALDSGTLGSDAGAELLGTTASSTDTTLTIDSSNQSQITTSVLNDGLSYSNFENRTVSIATAAFSSFTLSNDEGESRGAIPVDVSDECDSGSATADQVGETQVTLVFTNCAVETVGEGESNVIHGPLILNGTIAGVQSYTGDPFEDEDDWTLDLSITYTNLSMNFVEEDEVYVLNGTVSYDADYNASTLISNYSITSENYVADADGETIYHDSTSYQSNAASNSASLSFSYSYIPEGSSGAVTVSTSSPLISTLDDDDPVAGVIEITGTEGGSDISLDFNTGDAGTVTQTMDGVATTLNCC